MKTPREIIFGRHQEAVPALDDIRERAVAGIATTKASESRSPGTFIEFFISLRWHAAAISALWLLIAALGAENPEKSQPAVAGAQPPAPPMAGILAWRAYSEEFDEADSPPQRQAPAPIPHACIDPRRESERNDIA